MHRSRSVGKICRFSFPWCRVCLNSVRLPHPPHTYTPSPRTLAFFLLLLCLQIVLILILSYFESFSHIKSVVYPHPRPLSLSNIALSSGIFLVISVAFYQCSKRTLLCTYNYRELLIVHLMSEGSTFSPSRALTMDGVRSYTLSVRSPGQADDCAINISLMGDKAKERSSAFYLLTPEKLHRCSRFRGNDCHRSGCE